MFHDSSGIRYLRPQRVGEGGFAEVYKVTRDGDPLQTPFALKVFRPHPLAELRRDHEMDIGMRLQHPNLTSVYFGGDLEIDRAKTPYVLMDWVSGPTLLKIAPDRIKPETLVRELAQALGVIHAEGLIHADLKPDNVLMRDYRSPVILDWGLTVETGSLQHLGYTRQYSAPEILHKAMTTDGKPVVEEERCFEDRPLTPAADWYSLGKTLEHLRGRDIASSPALAALESALLQPDPQNRPQTADDVLAFLPRRAARQALLG